MICLKLVSAADLFDYGHMLDDRVSRALCTIQCSAFAIKMCKLLHGLASRKYDRKGKQIAV